MIGRLEGRLELVSPGTVVVDVAGVRAVKSSSFTSGTVSER